MALVLQKATAADLDRIAQIMESGRAYLHAQGSPQWQGGYGPNRASLSRNLAKQEGYILFCDGTLCGYAALISGTDEVYTNIAGGLWAETHGPYLSIHSVALAPSVRGRGLAAQFLHKLVETARSMGYSDVRIDTHACNLPMQRAILRAGFVHRGTVHFPIPNGARMAFQRVIP